MASEPKTGSLLRTLSATKPGGQFLELGAGTGIGTAWLLAGMGIYSRLVSIDTDPAVVAIAQRHLGHDPRVTFQIMDGAEFLIQTLRHSSRFYGWWNQHRSQIKENGNCHPRKVVGNGNPVPLRIHQDSPSAFCDRRFVISENVRR